MISVESNGTTLDFLGSPLIRVICPNLRKPLISLKLIELGRSNLMCRSPRTRTQTSCIYFFHRGGWGGRCPQLQFFTNFRNCSKRVELGSSYSGCRLIWTRPTVADITLPGRLYIWVPVSPPLISVLCVYL